MCFPNFKMIYSANHTLTTAARRVCVDSISVARGVVQARLQCLTARMIDVR